ncbi:Lrp/AsnC family transcriptional regulator [Novosphingobium aquimarinum]|uniref:Lrp/AsnC family transcriptional regulator n=1 Tax=Novosphingobium aquimarinum TaxID=2682494 RepID=UPI0012EB80F7|nr:Lrp/AsnC family transcriptional regulator [Novosphingobium aquimarinum]
MKDIEFDDTDRGILDALGNDARMSNRSIANLLGVAEGTVRARIKRLTARKILRFTAITDYRQHGTPLMALVRLVADHGKLEALATQISDITEIRSVIVTLGRTNLLCIGLFESQERLAAVCSEQIGILDGVGELSISTVVHAVKYNERMARLRPSQSCQP